MPANKKTNKLTEEQLVSRREVILRAAFECFLQHGFAKVSLDDIAKKARLSRPLLYLQFKNKKELLEEMLRDLNTGLVNNARSVLKLNISRREKLIRVYDELLIKFWGQITKTPSGKKFLGECLRMCPEVEIDYEKEMLKILTPIFEDKKSAEIFMLSVEGLCLDLPATATLRKRIQFLADRFLADD